MFPKDSGYANWEFNKNINSLIQDYDKESLNRLYEKDEINSMLGLDQDWYDFYIAH